MPASVFGHALETLHDGLTTIRRGAGFAPLPCPLTGTEIEVTRIGALAFVRITRRFRNEEAAPIEAVLSMPVGFDAVVCGLSVTVGDRTLAAQAQARDAARTAYEDGISRGKLAVLHEEVLRGVHMLSVANLDAGAEVSVALEITTPLTRLTEGALLRLPMTVGALYGASPLHPADDLVTSPSIRHQARLVLTNDRAELIGRGIILEMGGAVTLPLDAAIELRLAPVTPEPVTGTDAEGRMVRLDIQPAAESDGELDLAILVDRSGSTGNAVGDGLTVHQAMTRGLATALATLRADDRIGLWQFDNDCQCLGAATGPEAAGLARGLDGPRGGTELGGALRAVLGQGARDILVLTDGQTWAHEVGTLAGSQARISAVLVGSSSLDANIGHLATMTGGQVFHAAGADVGAVLVPALQAMRQASGPAEGRVAQGRPVKMTARRAGWVIGISWSGDTGARPDAHAQAIGRYAAALALPLMSADAATGWAVQHRLCTHATSLVLVDEASGLASDIAGEHWPQLRKVPLQAAMMTRMAMPSPSGAVAAARPRMARPAEAAPRLAEAFVPYEPPVHRRRAPGLPGRLHALATRIDWSVEGLRFLQGNLDTLRADERSDIAALAARSPVIALAQGNPHPVEIVALAILAVANAPRDRIALRFALRVLGQDGLRDAPSCYADALAEQTS